MYEVKGPVQISSELENIKFDGCKLSKFIDSVLFILFFDNCVLFSRTFSRGMSNQFSCYDNKANLLCDNLHCVFIYITSCKRYRVSNTLS